MDAELGNLTLTRYAGESITIGGNIVVRLVESKNGKAKVCITAPKAVRVLRSELITEGKRDDRDGTEAPSGAVRDGAGETEKLADRIEKYWPEAN